MLKRTYQIGIGAYIVLLVLALFFYKERTIFLDIAYHLFYIIKDGGFAIQNYRFGALFTQLFPLTALKAGLPLEGIMVSYSAGFIIYYLACYLVCGSLLKNYRMALCMLLLSVLFVTDTFFWMQSELPQGIAFMFVFLAFITKDKGAGPNVVLTVPLIIAGACFVAFFHPLLVFCFLYSILFFATRKNETYSKSFLWGALGCYAAMVVIKNIFFKTVYDSGAMEDANKLIEVFPHYFDLSTHKFFIQSCIKKYFWLPTAGVSVIVVYALSRDWLKLFMLIAFSVGYIVLVNISYQYDNAPAFYLENLYLPLNVFLGLPLAYDVLPRLQTRRLAVPVVLVLCLTAFARIVYIGGFYTKRLNWERAFVAKNLDKKLVMDAALGPREIMLQFWGSPYEFWLISTTEYGKTASLMFTDNIEDRVQSAFNRKDLLGQWESIPYEYLNPRYFILTDTVSRYTVIMK